MTSTNNHPGGSGFGAPQRSFEERAAAREQMMSNLRETSQQDRRVYVGNLSYDVKWHHLKDFMKQGMLPQRHRQDEGQRRTDSFFFHFAPIIYLAGEVIFADVLLLPNGMSKVGLHK